MSVERTFGAIGALLGLLGVAFGAFGAHALKARLTPEDLGIFEVGVRYQMYHALALLLLAALAPRLPGSLTSAAGWLFTAGVLVFSGSLYVLVLTGHRWLGAVTPIGGLALILGWALLTARILRG
jgi:uncharacterized membrane protein YgdD (TMEM256/DUF423 family)